MEIDIREQNIKDISPDLLKILLLIRRQRNLFVGEVIIIYPTEQSIIPIRKWFRI